MDRIYLDNCCFNRPYDNQTQLKIHLETQAKLQIQADALENKCELVWSYMLEYENSANPFEYRRNAIKEWKEIAKINVLENEDILKTAEKIQTLGIKAKDSIHIACAIFSKSNYFITTDKGILNKKIDNIKIITPIDYISNKEDDKNE